MALSVPKFLTIEGQESFREAQQFTTPGAVQTILTWAVGPSVIEKLYQLDVICRVEAEWFLDINSVIVASGRTGAAKPKDLFSWVAGRDAPSNSTVTLKLKSRTGSPIVGCEVYFQTSIINT